jgi:hypothetical protein
MRLTLSGRRAIALFGKLLLLMYVCAPQNISPGPGAKGKDSGLQLEAPRGS